MARALFFVGGLTCGFLLATALMVGHADEVQAEVQEAAAAAHVDPVKLQGAVNTTGLDPYDYLRGVGELEPARPSLPPPAPASPPGPASGVWAALAACESSTNWRANTGNGYLGGLQMNMAFWVRNGGLAYAARPDLASPTAQVAVAQHGLSVQGPGAWPVCSRLVGLR